MKALALGFTAALLATSALAQPGPPPAVPIPVGNTINVMSYLTNAQQTDVINRGGATDETAAITAAIAALGTTGGTLVFAPGKWNTTCGFTLAYPTLVTGSGQSAFNTTFGSGTTITCSNGAATLFTVNSTYARFEKIALQDTAGTRTAGSGIYVTSAYQEQRVDYEGVGVFGFYDGVDVAVGSGWVMHASTVQDSAHWGVRIRNTVNPDAGDWTIDDNVIYPKGGALAGIQYEGSGGGKITNNKIVPNSGSVTNGIYQDVTGNASIQTLIVHNDVEQMSGAALKIVAGYRDTIIADNFFQTQSGSGLVVDLANIDSMVFANNILRGGGAYALGLSSSTVTHTVIAPNVFQGAVALVNPGSLSATTYRFDQTLVASNNFVGQTAGLPTFNLNSVGSFWGQIMNTSSDVWALGYGATNTANGTASFTWSPTAVGIAKPLTFTGTIPTVTGTGSPTITTGSTDTTGEVTGGTLATSIVITFSAAKTNAPFCLVTAQTNVAAFAYTTSTTAITITLTATTGEKINYACFQH